MLHRQQLGAALPRGSGLRCRRGALPGSWHGGGARSRGVRRSFLLRLPREATTAVVARAAGATVFGGPAGSSRRQSVATCWRRRRSCPGTCSPSWRSTRCCACCPWLRTFWTRAGWRQASCCCHRRTLPAAEQLEDPGPGLRSRKWRGAPCVSAVLFFPQHPSPPSSFAPANLVACRPSGGAWRWNKWSWRSLGRKAPVSTRACAPAGRAACLARHPVLHGERPPARGLPARHFCACLPVMCRACAVRPVRHGPGEHALPLSRLQR